MRQIVVVSKPGRETFEPNAVFIPASAIPDNRTSHSCIDPADCTLLYLDGDRHSSYAYTKEAWLQECAPSYALTGDAYYKADGTYLCRAGLSITDQDPVEGDRIQLLPEMYVLKTDDTEYWDKELLQRLKVARVFSVYVFNRRKETYLCEMQPSYELRFFCSQWDGAEGYDAEDEGPGDIDEAIREGARGTDEWSYQHCSDVDRLLETVIKENGMWLPPVGKGGGGYKVTGLYVTEEDAYEGIRESQRNGDL